MDRNEGVIATKEYSPWSLSARRAWIEMVLGLNWFTRSLSLSARRAWIEMIDNITQGVFNLSLSARRAWIEIIKKGRARRPGQVALRKESVDRNHVRYATSTRPSIVALRKESVDRNIKDDVS